LTNQAEIKAFPQRGRGVGATSPTSIPAKGWKDILRRTWSEISDDRILLVAAGVTFYLLLALFPTLTAFVSIYGLFTDSSTVAKHVSMLAAYVPAGFLEIIKGQLTALTDQEDAALGWGFVISLALALWSASSGVKTMFEAMNVAYDERERRNFFVLSGLALLVMLAALLVGIVMITVVVVIPAVLSFVGLSEGFEWLTRLLGYLFLAAVLFAGLTVLYRIGPSRPKQRWRWLTPGAVFACATVIAASALFSWYSSNFANYEKTYGSLGALIGLLTWMWISVTVIIIGAELNAEIEHQTAGKLVPRGGKPVLVPASTKGDPPEEQPTRHTARPRTLGSLVFAVPAALVLGWFARRSQKRD
jgi:membrane protein